MEISGIGQFRLTGKEIEDYYDVVIIGAGPAGLSASIYAKRSGLSVLVIDKGLGGGVVLEDPLIENYLSHRSIKGEELGMLMKSHASEYATILESENIKEIKKNKNNFVVNTDKYSINCSSIIIATGTTHKKLGIEGENKYFGKGVSYCVTCDAYFFRNKKVAVIGGANSGAISAVYLESVGVNTDIFEYMPKYMCEDAYIKKLKELNIPYHMNTQITEILGDGTKVNGVSYIDRATGEKNVMQVDGVFIYVGLLPQVEPAKMLNLELNGRGYIVTDRKCRTSVPKVYAAGDVTGEAGQIIISAGQGAVAALSAYEDIKVKNSMT